jgi:hypothetical protein
MSIRSRTSAAKSLTARIETLRSAQSQYLLFEQMGVLVYALNASGLAAAGSSEHDTLSSLYQLALLDRSTSMRQMIGELARAKQLTYRETSDKYGALIATARKDVSLASYQAVDDFETQTMRQADALMARLQDTLLSAERTKGQLDALAAKAQASTHCGHDARIDAAPGGESHVREGLASRRNARVLRGGRRRGAAHRTRHAGIEDAGRREDSRGGRNAYVPRRRLEALKVNQPPV